MILFNNDMVRKVLFTREIIPPGGSDKSETKIKRKDKKNLNSRIKEEKEEKEEKEHIMNRNKSIENFVKYSWSWTI